MTSSLSSRLPVWVTGIILAGLGLAALGYWKAWVPAEPAGLRVLGLDLAEYVKFVAEVRSGQIRVLREVFYLPLVSLSLSLSLLCHRPELRLPGAVRWLLNALAVPAALAMLPPAWTPALLTTPEFVKQSVAIGGCVLAALLARPLLRRLPAAIAATVVFLLALAAMTAPVAAFVRLRPALDAIYGHPTGVGAGPGVMLLGFALLATAALTLAVAARPGRALNHPAISSNDRSPGS